jgi:hypothetical protein
MNMIQIASSCLLLVQLPLPSTSTQCLSMRLNLIRFSMYTDMMDITSQLILKWERFGPNHAFDVSDDFTRLAFDTISLCAMGHRLNSFYTHDVSGHTIFISSSHG